MTDYLFSAGPGPMPEMDGPHEPHAPRGPEGPRGLHDAPPPHHGSHDAPPPPPHHGPHGAPPPPHHGPHGAPSPPHHGPHGAPPPPPPPPSHIDWEKYRTLGTEEKLLAMIRALGHTHRHFDDRGGQDRVLDILQEGEAMTQRELTERLGIRPGSASELIGKLERAGFVSRTPSETDRRTADVRLTPAGAAHRAELAEKRQNERPDLFAALSEEERTTLLTLLERLHAAWHARPGAEDDDPPPPPPPLAPEPVPMPGPETGKIPGDIP